MPIALFKRPDTPYYWARGSYLGISICRTTKALKRAAATKVVRQWESEIERGRFSGQGRKTFLEAAVSYLQAGGEKRTVKKLIEVFRERYLDEIDQAAIDAVAAELHVSPATRNREVYSPISAILKHAGEDFRIKRPGGSRGRQITDWLRPDEAHRLFDAARQIDREFASLLVFLCYTGCRLSEALNLQCADVNLTEGEAYVRHTKNGQPRRVHLPAVVIAEIANHPRGVGRTEKLFRWSKCGRLYGLLERCAQSSGVVFPQRAAFHLFRHTYATWMRRYAGADSKTLVATGAWKSEQSASRYAHTIVTEEARLADRLPAQNPYKPTGTGDK